ncbi:MAG: SMI1/KNR4 family protein [Chitinophagales bacterium]|nr:SMI1/KNR4 family protein [Chitinophagales bacterium]
MIKFKSTSQSITIADIEEFETNFQVKLPANYKELLLKFNGGYNPNVDDTLRTLYSIRYGKHTVEFGIQVNQIWEDNIPKDYLGIGGTGLGDEITICVKEGDDYGKIFLFRLDTLEPELLSDSLEDFLGVESIEDLGGDAV